MSKEEKRKRGKKALLGVFKFLVLPILSLIIFNWKIALGIFGIFLISSMYKIRKRKYFVKDIAGKELGLKQFMTRWKHGIEGITPLQQSRTSLLGNWITLSGILGGITINALVRISSQWIWIEVILGGSLILVVVQMIGGFQKFWRFKESEKAQKQFNEIMQESEKPKKKRVKKEKVKTIKMEKIQ